MYRTYVLLALFAITFCLFSPAALAKGHSGEVIPGSFIVTLREDAQAESIAQAHGLRPHGYFRKALNGFVFKGTATNRDRLKRDAKVLDIEPDRIVEVEEVRDFAIIPGVTAVQPAQKLPTGINRIDADLSINARIDGVDERTNIDVAVIDTGIDLTHPDLNVVKSVSFTGTATGNDDHGHGTHVAGTIAGIDNTTGVVGVAPGARLWAVKVLGSNGSGSLSSIIAGVDYVTKNAQVIKVANMSLGMNGTSRAFNAAISRSVAAGVTYVVAAGNSNMDATRFSPANHPDVICVSAVADYDGKGGGSARGYSDADDTLADFSNYGAPVDIAAPGVRIYSTYRGGSYATMSGTSMASPHAAGAAALYLANNPAATPLEVKNALRSLAKPASDPLFGFTGDRDSVREPMLHASKL